MTLFKETKNTRRFDVSLDDKGKTVDLVYCQTDWLRSQFGFLPKIIRLHIEVIE